MNHNTQYTTYDMQVRTISTLNDKDVLLWLPKNVIVHNLQLNLEFNVATMSHRRIKSSDLLELITSSTDIRFEKIHSYWKARKRSEGLVFVGILMITQNGALAFVGLRKFPSWMMQKTPMTMRQMSWVKICMSEMLTHSPMDVEIKRLQILQRSRGA